jgi:thiol:disulfide interchange protein DsbD
MLKTLSALLCVISMMAWAEPDTEFLEPEQALKMSASARDHQTVEVRFAIAQGY